MYKVRYAIAGLAALLSSTSTYAADLAAQPIEPTAPVATPYDWSGPYIGIHAGGGWGRENDDQSRLFGGTTTTTTVAADHFNVSGFVGGVHAGYNFQVNEFVYGVEGDLDYAGLTGSTRGIYGGGGVVRRLKLRTDWQGSARVRAGYAFDRLLVYATGGLAIANGKLSNSGVNGVDFAIPGTSSTNTHVGWTVGLGAEYAFTQNWIGRAEVRYSDFGKKSYQTFDGKVKAGWNQTTATVGVSYKF